MIVTIIGSICILIGSVSILIAAIGLFRLPGLLLKMHAATKTGTLGAGLILFGIALQLKGAHAIVEAILLITFIAITNPISAHLIAKANYKKE